MINKPVILVINPGSTSTKLAIYQGEEIAYEENIRHNIEELSSFKTIYEQFPFRKLVALQFLEKIGFTLHNLDCVVGRGGFLKPISGGAYLVDNNMCQDLVTFSKEHASNLGALLAKFIADGAGIPAFIVDPIVVDEMEPLARFSGLAGIERKSVLHALNQKACARKAATHLNKRYEECSLIVVHLGGGISVGAHKNGRVIDTNNGLDGDGPFSTDRAGGVPVGGLLRFCLESQLSEKEVYKRIVGKGGLIGYLGTNDARKVEEMISGGNEKARLVYEAMAYQVAKEIGSCAAVLKGEIDAIVLTGGLVYSKMFKQLIQERVEFLAPILSFPGEDEMAALALAGLRVLSGEEEAKKYS